jgi:HPt (histidine-containing phosphotransfer) domain-containing protein
MPLGEASRTGAATVVSADRGYAGPIDHAMNQERRASINPDSPIDRDYLGRQCQGDEALEHELLGLFATQVRDLAAALSGASGPSEGRANIAHKLKGSALAIGAGRVARAAAAFEDAARLASPEPACTAELDASVAEAVTEIERIRR